MPGEVGREAPVGPVMTITFPNGQADGTRDSPRAVVTTRDEKKDGLITSVAKAWEAAPYSKEVVLLWQKLEVRKERHDHELRMKEVDLQSKRLRYGLIIGMFAITAGSVTAISGAELPGGFIGTGGVIGLVALFVKGQLSN